MNGPQRDSKRDSKRDSDRSGSDWNASDWNASDWSESDWSGDDRIPLLDDVRDWLRDQRAEGQFELILQLGLAVAIALLIGWMASLLATLSFLFAVNYWLIPGTLIAGFVWRKRGLFNILPFFLFGILFIVFLPLPAYGSLIESFILVIASLSFLTITGRIQEIRCEDGKSFVTEQLDYLPSTTHVESQQPGFLQWGTFATILVAWLVAIVLTWSFSRAATHGNEFEAHRLLISMKVGLVPWAYHGIRLVMIFSLLFVVCHGVSSYLRTRQNTNAMSWLLLRHELWRWNRWEQRKIAKLMRKKVSR